MNANSEDPLRASMADKPLWRRILNWPSTRLGWWSAGCLAGAFAFLCLFYGLVASGQRGGETFFSNPLLTLTMLAAAGSAIAGGAVASAAIFSKQERSILSVVALAFGFTVVVFVIGEIAFPH